MWSLGDYSQVSPFLEACAQKLADACAIAPGMTVLDVAAGDGNFALAAAERGATITASDYTPKMVELGRARSAAAGIAVEWVEADAEDLPFDPDSFDVVASVFGAMFAPRPDVLASELFRVCKPGGIVAMANYGWHGFLGDYAKLLRRFSSRSPVPFPQPFEWGEPATVRARLGGLASSLDIREETLEIKGNFEFWERTNGPTIALRQTLAADRYEEFRREASAFMEGGEHASSYLIVIARK